MGGMLGQLWTEIGQGGGNIYSVVHDRTFLAHEAKSPREEVEIEVAEERKGSTKPFVRLGARHNVYSAWGSYIEDSLYRWTRETNARALGLNVHVSYIHAKFVLHDPLGRTCC